MTAAVNTGPPRRSRKPPASHSNDAPRQEPSVTRTVLRPVRSACKQFALTILAFGTQEGES